MKKIEGFIFDLDGVLVDTAKYHHLAWKSLAADLGYDLKPEDNEKLKGVSRMASLEIILSLANKKINEEKKVELANKKNALYLEFLSSLSESDILLGAKNFLLSSKKLGLGIALASASKNALLVLRSLNLLNFFDAIVDGNYDLPVKPAPDIFITASMLLKLKVGEVLVFEDSIAGIDGARSAGIKTIGIGSKEVLNRADLVLSSFENKDPSYVIDFFQV